MRAAVLLVTRLVTQSRFGVSLIWLEALVFMVPAPGVEPGTY